MLFFFFQAEDGIRDVAVTGVQTCALPISGKILRRARRRAARRFRSPRRWVSQLEWRRILWCRISLRPQKLFWGSWKGAAKRALAAKGGHQNPRVPRRRWHAGRITQSGYEQASLRDR